MKKIIELLLIVIITFLTIFIIRKIFYSKDSNAILSFNNNIHNFGNIDHLENVNHYFIFKNVGNSNLEIDSTSTSCGCTVAKNINTIILPKQNDSIYINLSTDVLGYFTKEIVVFSNSETSPDHLYIKGNIVK